MGDASKWMKALIEGPPLDLRRLRPVRGTDPAELARLVEDRGWRSALPSAFSDDMLLRLLRDFRDAQEASEEQRDGRPLQSFVPTAYVVRSLLLQHPMCQSDCVVRGTSSAAIGRVLQTYHRALEQELARRVTGIGPAEDAEGVATALWRALGAAGG